MGLRQFLALMLELWCVSVPGQRAEIVDALYADLDEMDEDERLDHVAHVLNTGGEVVYDG